MAHRRAIAPRFLSVTEVLELFSESTDACDEQHRMTSADTGDLPSTDVHVLGPICPFWRAVATDQRHVDPHAPAPLRADRPESVAAAAERLAYHTDFGSLSSGAIAELLVVAANSGASAKIKGLFTQSYLLNDLSGGFLDKDLDSGLLKIPSVDNDGQGQLVGVFNAATFDKMFSDEFASDHVVDGTQTRALNIDQLEAWIAYRRSQVGGGRVHLAMARVEMTQLLINLIGTDATRADGTTEPVVTRRSAELLYKEGIFPHERLKEKLDELYPER